MSQPSQSSTASAPGGEICRLAEHLFRHEAGKLVSVLTRIFGIDRLQMAEDVVQEALVRALQTWPYYGVPRNPAAWLTRTAKNLALDLIRREKKFREKQPQIIACFEQWPGDSDASQTASFEIELEDERLRLMFACCHPRIPHEAQIALALKTLCGFGPAEIASAFLTTETAVMKRLTRARRQIREWKISFEIPAEDQMPERLESVLRTLYLLFNEGYKASSGERLIREELCREAIRLVELLATHPAGNNPKVHALAALMLLNAARLPARLDANGQILRLDQQDRSRWDKTLIARGMHYLARSASGPDVSEYHVHAAISAAHCAAKDYSSTDWARILALYDQLARMDDSPIIALNRAVAVARVHGPGAGIDAVMNARRKQPLQGYYLLFAVLAEFEFELGNHEKAADYFREAIRLAELKSERAFLSQRLRECEASRERADAVRLNPVFIET